MKIKQLGNIQMRKKILKIIIILNVFKDLVKGRIKIDKNTKKIYNIIEIRLKYFS